MSATARFPRRMAGRNTERLQELRGIIKVYEGSGCAIRTARGLIQTEYDVAAFLSIIPAGIRPPAAQSCAASLFAAQFRRALGRMEENAPLPETMPGPK